MRDAWRFCAEQAVTLLGVAVAAVGLVLGAYVACHSGLALLSLLS